MQMNQMMHHHQHHQPQYHQHTHHHHQQVMKAPQAKIVVIQPPGTIKNPVLFKTGDHVQLVVNSNLASLSTAPVSSNKQNKNQNYQQQQPPPPHQQMHILVRQQSQPIELSTSPSSSAKNSFVRK
jgi:hypothetical protein